MKKMFLDFLKFSGSVLAISSAVVLHALPVSCKLTDEGFEIVEKEKDTTPPVLNAFRVLSSECVRFEFSEPVTLSSLVCEDDGGGEIPLAGSGVSLDESGTVAEIRFGTPTETGGSYTIGAVATDSDGNTCSFEQKFLGFNENPAKIILNEVFLKGSTAKKNPQTPYIEFYVLKGGNLSGMKVCTGYNSKEYCFPSIDVNEGEFFILHWKSPEDSEPEDELSDDLNLSKSPQSYNGVRDLWIPESSFLSGSTDVLSVVDSFGDCAVDGIVYLKSEDTSFSRKNQKDLAAQLSTSGVWNTSEKLLSEGLSSSTKSLSRTNLQDMIGKFRTEGFGTIVESSEFWAVSPITPGKPNSN